MPPPLYHKEAADVKTAKDCLDSLDRDLSPQDKIELQNELGKLYSSSALTRQQAYSSALAPTTTQFSKQPRFYSIENPNTSDKISELIGVNPIECK